MAPRPQSYRKVIYIRLDTFYATAEQHGQAELQQHPVLIGHPSQKRGRVESASADCFALGIRLLMPMKTALQLCPEAICLSPTPEKYRQHYDNLVALCHEHTDLVESAFPAGLYLDVTYNKDEIPFGQRLAKLLKSDILRRLGATTAFGLATNKLLAYVAAKQSLPDGLRVIHANQAADFLAALPLSTLPQLDKNTCHKLAQLEVHTNGQLADFDHRLLIQHFGRKGAQLWAWSRGLDDTPVLPDSPPKQLSQEIHFPTDLYDMQEIHFAINDLLANLNGRLRRRRLVGRILTLTIHYPNHSKSSHSCPLVSALDPLARLTADSHALLEQSEAKDRGVRFLSMAVSDFSTGPVEQLDLFL